MNEIQFANPYWLYLLILLPVSLAGSLLEKKLRYAGFGT